MAQSCGHRSLAVLETYATLMGDAGCHHCANPVGPPSVEQFSEAID
jgi:hypothetical protein